jgi:ABC-2 type transport system permease protein
MGWFYATPIVYPIALVQTHLSGDKQWMFTLYKLNPMTRLVEAYRDAMYDLRFPRLVDVAYLLACGVVAMVLGLYVFSRLQSRLAEEL